MGSENWETPCPAMKLHGNIIDLRGQTFGWLRVLSYEGRETSGHALWRCRCKCGKIVVVRGTKIRAQRVKSCGCWKRNPAVRRTARLQIPAKLRKMLAGMRKSKPDRSDSV